MTSDTSRMPESTLFGAAFKSMIFSLSLPVYDTSLHISWSQPRVNRPEFGLPQIGLYFLSPFSALTMPITSKVTRRAA